ncbi:hypothetical protein HTZ77_11060 [Nonomuraea sp. SMC257]|uniref:DUF3291 domain-containing protein n=1 Tax=Nonomuraea montanisoli TaxID=2741721 RepID=A0A7Y6I5J5_9ACTN|nr:hypothetical protein [Nonomuraea montanisoli]NUW31964.1 hypothetical protein [Nonomuraea montanisoli]
MLRSRWTPGEAAGTTGTVLVSVTDYRADRMRDLPGVYRDGLALRRSWSELPGAVGMWLWTEPLRGRCGSVSIWRDDVALRRFVAWPQHVAVVRRHRGHGRLRSTTWTTTSTDRGIWDRALAYLAGETGTP